MALKDVNLFEKHVEKLVIGAAAAGAVFMGYLAVQKVSVPDEDIGPGEVEPSIQHAIEGLKESEGKIELLGQPKVQVRDFTTEYNNLSRQQPLDGALVRFVVPPIGAINLSPQRIEGPHDELTKLITPDPVGIEYLRAEASQFQVANEGLQPGTTLQPGMVLRWHDQKVVILDGYIPVGQMIKQMALASEKDKAKIPLDRQRVVIQNIRVLRCEILPNGGQTAFVPVEPTKAIIPPIEQISWGARTSEDVIQIMNDLDLRFKDIVIPDFYQDPQGVAIAPPILKVPLPEKIDAEIKDLNKAIEAAKANAVLAPTGRGPAGFGGTQPLTTPVAVTMLPPDPAALRSLEVIPFTFWDETVKPGHTYRYQISVEFVNPVFGWQYGLKVDGDKLKGVLAAAPITTKEVKVRSDVEFFVSEGGMGKPDEIQASVFKNVGGHWYRGEISVPPGVKIAGKIPKPDEGPNQYIDVDTEYVLVDFQTIKSAAGNPSGIHVILKDPMGNLVTRDSATDWLSPERMHLMEENKKSVTTMPSDNTAQPVATTPPPAPVTPPGGRTLTTPPVPPGARTTPPVPPGARTTPPVPGRIPVNPTTRTR